MAVDHRQGAILAQFQELVVRQIGQLFLVNEMNIVDGLVLAGPQRQADALLGEQVQLSHQGGEPLGLARLLLVGGAEIQRLLGQVRHVFAVEEGPHALAGIDAFGGAVNAQRKAFILLVAHEHERIAAHIGRHVAIGIPAAFLRDEQILALLQAHGGNRDQLFPADENNRIVQPGGRKFRHRYRDGIGGFGKAVIGLASQSKIPVLVFAQDFRLAVE